MKKISITTFGCKINQYESSCIVDDFQIKGYEITDSNEIADVYVINTCTVTNRTDYKSRNAIRKALKVKENNKNIKIIVTGCYSQRNVEEVKSLGNIDLIVDNNHKNEILNFLSEKKSKFNDILQEINFSEQTTSRMLDRSRAYIKIQDGCDFYCAYCAIPYARGHSRSRLKENVLKQISMLVTHGFFEFVLAGINLGLYGKDLYADYFLCDLIKDIEKIEGVRIIRLSSIEPQLFTDELINLFSQSNIIAPHFHIPLQTGSDFLLKKMNRRYSKKQFQKLLFKLKNVRNDVAIGIDVIAGLPGETEILFQEAVDFLESLPITYIHGFSYSKRFGTKAAEMKNHVNGTIIKERNKIFHQISSRKLEEFKNYLIEKKSLLSGIMEDKQDNHWTALSDHYVRIYYKNENNLKRKFMRFIPVKSFKDGIEVVPSD